MSQTASQRSAKAFKSLLDDAVASSPAPVVESVPEASAPAPVVVRPARFARNTKPADLVPERRRGKKALTFYVNDEAHRAFRILCLERNKLGEEMLVEALNDLSRKYNKPPIA